MNEISKIIMEDTKAVTYNKLLGEKKLVFCIKGRLFNPEEHANKDKTSLYGTFRLQVLRQSNLDEDYGISYDNIYCVIPSGLYSTMTQQEFIDLKDYEILVEIDFRCTTKKGTNGVVFNNASFYISSISKLRKINMDRA